ncbi:MAG TPA: FtsQ-type POTRA domain-containing protein [Sulfurivirga caldicuralii]|nr:FtsQ-type POTRA domain-containing protein [Sulfurivirga caldicuralii]
MTRRMWLGWILALALLVGALVALLALPVVKEWEIHLPDNPAVQVDEQAVKALLQPFEGQRFLTLPLDQVRQAVMRHPWVADARVVRIWPDRVRIEVMYQRPVARWGERALVNEYGVVFYPSHLQGFEQLLRLDGPEVQDAAELLTMAVWLRQQMGLKGWQLIGVKRHAGGSVETRWWPQRTIWGEMEDYRAQFSRFMAAWPQVRSALREAAISVDLRYSNGFTIRTEQLSGSDGQHGAQKTEQ